MTCKDNNLDQPRATFQEERLAMALLRRAPQPASTGKGGGRAAERNPLGPRTWGAGVRPYSLAVGIVGAATALRWALDPLLAGGLEFMTYFPAVAVAALLGGARAGAVATLLSALGADLLFIQPTGVLEPLRTSDWIALGFFAVGGGSISWMAGIVGSAKEREGQALERERGAEDLRQSEQLHRAFFELGPVAMTYAGPDGHLLRVNDTYCTLCGYSREELLRMTFFELTHPEDRPKDCEVFDAYVRGELPVYACEKRYVRKDGSVRWVDAVGRLVRGADGRPLYSIGILQDVTPRKEAEAVLARSKQELEHLVAQRTAKLQELVAELEHFSYTITHDLKSPLRAMQGFAHLATTLSGEGARAEVKEALRKISAAAERMDALIADALNYSQSVRQQLPLSDVDTAALLRGMLESYPEFQPSKAHIQVEGTLPVVLGNEAGLTQCFSNLLGNAVKFVKPGDKPQIRVWAQERDGWARIWVEDRGIGISKEMLPRVFDMFSRASREYEGTGIGLALVRKVMQRMDGRLGVESHEGQGSRFWLELKLGRAGSTRARPASAPAEPKRGAVLYVEDEESDVIFMQMAFAQQGMESALRAVGDSRAAIDYLSGAGKYADRSLYPLPSVILLDLNLPQVPGFEVLGWMRNQPALVRTPVVVFSSSTREDDRAKALALGASEFVAKPSSALKFADVAAALKQKWLAAAASPPANPLQDKNLTPPHDPNAKPS